VHAAVTSSQERKRPNQKETRQEQLAHIQEERLSEGAAVAAEPPALPPDTRKFLEFAETHRTVLNQILRQSTTHLADGPFAVLVRMIAPVSFD
jgi:E3 ubiquitin-protein ligase HUWE1